MSKINQYNEKGQRHGLWKFYWSNGQLTHIGTYVNGKPYGLWEFYYFNGQLFCKGTYVYGKPYGLWKYYNQDGTIEKQVFYSKHLYEQD